MPKRISAVGGEAEAGRRAIGQGGWRRIDDRVGQAASCPDDRRGAVAQTVELIEPRGFVGGWHEEQVGPGLDAMGQRFAEAQAEPEPARVALAKAGEQV